MIDRYGPELTRDFFEKGLDFYEWANNPGKHQILLWVIDGLPGSSNYASALRNDPEQLELQRAELASDVNEDGEDWSPSDVGWTLELELLALLCELIANQHSDGKGEPWKFPRPHSLIDDIREHFRQQEGMVAFADLGFDLTKYE